MINQASRKISGFTIIEVLVVIVVLAIVASGAYLFLAKKTGDFNPIGAVQKTAAGLTLNPNCDYKDPDLCKFLNNFKQQQNYSISAQSTDKSGASSNITLDINGNQNYHLAITGQGTTNYNVIVLGNTTYTLDITDHKWWKQETSQSASSSATLKSDVSFQMPTNDPNAKPEDKATFEKQGKEACGNLTCFKYHVMAGANANEMSTIWFDDSQYLLRKVEMTDTDGNKSTIEYHYDGKVNITAPSPTKTAAPDQIIIPSEPGMVMPTISAQDMQDLQRISNDMQQQMPMDGPTGATMAQ